MQLALKGQYTARPNPLVGCVLVQFDEKHRKPLVIGEGYHAYYGGPHAEIVALNQARSAGFSIEGAVAYLNLAPCCHTGKTPPCVDALIKAKVSEVVYVMEDPNPISPSHQASMLLHQAGIKSTQITEAGLLKQAHEINQGFISRMRHNRPYVRAKVALSLDGNMALNNYQSQWITGTAARAHAQHYRALSGAIITGMGTVIYDNPSLTVRNKQFVELDNFKQPVSVLIYPESESESDFKLNLDIADKNIVKKSDTLFFNQDLPGMLSILAQKHEINEVLLESGPGLLNQFLAQNLIDELLIYLAPKLLGKGAMNLSQFGPIEQLTQAKEWVFQKMEQVGEDIAIMARPKSKD